MKEPVDHILRPSVPWRFNEELGMTECGYASHKVKTLTREEFFSRLLDMGERRTAVLTCMTCMETARRWKTFAEDPVQAIQREVQSEYRREKGPHSLRDELRAIAKLVQLHKGEFGDLLFTVQFNEVSKKHEVKP